jgi:crotonobetainyl-CoA:carnitine CoA-transferase CaiB-like acyl-CoA transferase
MAGPLSGIRVIDLTTVVSGPVSTVLLADQGADVIKIEPPGGDISRRTGGKGQFTAMFVSCNRGKRSLSLDLKKPQAMEVLRRLIASADVLVQNFRPGMMERLGLDDATIRALNPRLVYMSISGVGETGPYVEKRVYDPVIQSLSGFADIQSNQTTGRPQLIRTIVADKTTAIYASQAICAALFARERGGQGQHIRLSMLDTMVAYLWPEGMTQYTVVGNEATALSPTARPDLIFQTLDGFITVGSVSDSEWQGLCKVLGRPEWIDDPRFKTTGQRNANAAERITLVGEILATGHCQAWLDQLDAAEVPCAPVLRRAEVMNNVQVINNRIIEQFEQPSLGTVRQARPAARFEATPARIGGPAPAIGEHTDAVLAELGYSAAEIDALKNLQAASQSASKAASQTA